MVVITVSTGGVVVGGKSINAGGVVLTGVSPTNDNNKKQNHELDET